MGEVILESLEERQRHYRSGSRLNGSYLCFFFNPLLSE